MPRVFSCQGIAANYLPALIDFSCKTAWCRRPHIDHLAGFVKERVAASVVAREALADDPPTTVDTQCGSERSSEGTKIGNRSILRGKCQICR